MPAPGYHGNLLMLVPALPSFPTAPPDATGCGVCSSVPSRLAQWWSLWASVLGGGGAGVTEILTGVGETLNYHPGPPVWMAVGRKGLP